ncbi:MAG: thioredoxin-dependent thiol peroxidase [Spirochaetaceae bacterium]|nr:MAG: thioredoxin-dependent thiol peroxidase [Spirochaetaceae bacterium]
MAELKNGASGPAFSLLDQDGTKVQLSEYAGKKLLLYFYPKADTPGCTTQACSIRDAMPDLSDSGITAVGISPDKPAALKKFKDKYDLNFTLLSDPDHKIAEAYGTWGKKSMYGKEYEGIIRSSFLLDEQGKVIRAWYKVSPKDTVPLAREALAG